MERITSRKNKIITHLRALGAEKGYRLETGLFLCDGEKLLREAVESGAEPECVLWCESPAFELDRGISQICAPKELLEYVSPLKNTPGPVFSVKMRKPEMKGLSGGVIILENVQDPGNVGTILRTANAMGIGAALLLGQCADLYNPKTVRSTMGAVFRQPVIETDTDGLKAFLAENNLKLYGAALSEKARDIRTLDLKNHAVAVGSEGAGLSEKLLSMCDGQLIIPMAGGAQSLNAAVAASIIMWEMRRGADNR